MLDIRIREQQHEQPVLFGPLLKITTYQLIDWETEQPVDTHHYETMGEAERATYNRLRPYLRQIAAEEAEREES